MFSIIGFFAQLVDGALGMAYGATSASLLIMIGVAPAAASASIHLAEVATTAASGASHLWFGNVDRGMAFRLIVPGAAGAFAGAAFLSRMPGEWMRPFVSGFLILLGVYILFRFLRMKPPSSFSARQSPKCSGAFLVPLGCVGGFLDAVGGGGWGPVTTPALMAKAAASPRKVIGTVDTSEFAVAVSATLGFLIFLGPEQIHWRWVAALVIGGVAAAPLAAWLVKILPAHLMGVLVGGFIILTNVRTLATSTDLVPDAWKPAVYGIVILLWSAAVIRQLAGRGRLVRRPPHTTI